MRSVSPRSASAGGGAPRARPLTRRVAFVRQVAERLAATTTLDDVGDVVASHVREGLGALGVTLAVLNRDGVSFTTLVAEGVSDETKRRMSGRVPLDAWPPAGAAVRERRPLLWPSIADRDREYPVMAGYSSTAQSWAVLPLVVRGAPIGVVSIGWRREHPFPDVEKAILQVIAHQCAVALDRARIEEARQAERETLELLSEGTQVMVSALVPRQVIDALVRLAVPRLAPFCAVYVSDGEMLRRIAVEIEGEREFAAALQGQAAVSIDGENPLAVALRSGEPQTIEIDAEYLRRAFPSPAAHRVLSLGSRWTMVAVPVMAGGEALGVMVVLSARWPTGPPDQVRFAAEGLAARAGVALVNARRFDDERRTAALLTEAFLPAEIPDLPGYDVAATYLPAGSRVAGDWYDVARLPSGRYLVGIGDVGGHGIRSASLMGQLRNGARGLAITGHGPGPVLDGLRLMTEADGGDSFATALYATVDPGRHAVRWASAGHLPPLEFRDGSAWFTEHPRQPPLGWPSPAATELHSRWQPGHGVVLVTDGVVERRDASLADGLEALRALVAPLGALSAADLTEEIVQRLCREVEDDCCVLVLKRA